VRVSYLYAGFLANREVYERLAALTLSEADVVVNGFPELFEGRYC